MSQPATQSLDQRHAYQGPVISAESYVAEPADLWQQRLSGRFADRAPRIEAGPNGDQLLIEGAPARPLAWHGPLAELPRVGVKPRAEAAYRYADEPRPEGCDASARLRYQDALGLAGEVLYPRLGLFIATSPDPQFQQAACGIYNDWLAEFLAASPGRLKGMALMPAKCDIEVLTAEARKAAAAGFSGVVLPARHAMLPYNAAEWDPFWAALQETGLVCAAHLGAEEGAVATAAGPGAAGIVLCTGKYELNEFLQMAIWSGAAMRYPRLKFGLIGSGVGWLATQLTLMDHWWNDHKGWLRPRLEQQPSAYWRRQFFATFLDDGPGLATREIIGVENLAWGSGQGAPGGTDKPREQIARTLGTLPGAEVDRIVHSNAAALHGFRA